MKILLTNNQILFLLSEAIDERYMDYLLDKMMGQGLTDEEQSDLQRMSRGEEISKDVPDNEEPKVSLKRERLPIQEPPQPRVKEPKIEEPKRVPDIPKNTENQPKHSSQPVERKSYKNVYQNAFFKLFPTVQSITTNNNNIWGIDLNYGIFGEPVIVLSDGDNEVFTYCFYGASLSFTFQLTDSIPQKSWVYHLVKDKPKNNEQMTEFTNQFVNEILPLIMSQIETAFQNEDDEEFGEDDPRIDEVLVEKGFRRIK